MVSCAHALAYTFTVAAICYAFELVDITYAIISIVVHVANYHS